MKKAIIIAIIGLGSEILVSCGDINVEKPKDSNIRVIDDTKPSEKTEDKKEDVKPVEACKAIDKSDPDRWRYGTKQADWFEATSSAPAGWRIATRTEIMEAWDSGALGSDGPTENVWTATQNQKKDGQAWYFNINNGVSYSSGKDYKLRILYIRDEQ